MAGFKISTLAALKVILGTAVLQNDVDMVYFSVIKVKLF